MEPSCMIFAQTGTMAAMRALEQRIVVQDVHRSELCVKLAQEKWEFSW